MNVGVIGYGYWGPKLVRNFSEIEDCRLSYVADRSTEALARVHAHYPTVRTTTYLEDLLASDVDAVVVATPIRTHYTVAEAALLAGKHVMVEKPLTASVSEAEALVQLADRAGLTLMVGHTFQYNAAINALREIVASGELGEVFYVDAARLNLGLFQKDINVLWDLAPHDISILSHVLQHDPIAVSARGSWSITPGVEDVAYVELRFPGDLLAHLHLSWLDPCKVRRVTLVGSKKMVVCDDVQDVEKIRIYDKGVERRHETDQFREFPLTYRYGGIAIPHVPVHEPLRRQCEHFLECARSNTRPLSDGRSGLNVVRVLESAEFSLRNGGVRVSIQPDAGRAMSVTQGTLGEPMGDVARDLITAQYALVGAGAPGAGAPGAGAGAAATQLEIERRRNGH
jgi:predicted dehydrogenase